MCPIWPLHIIILYLLALCPLWVLCQAVPNLTATFDPDKIQIYMDEYTFFNVTIGGLDTGFQAGDTLHIEPDRTSIASTEDFYYPLQQNDIDYGSWTSNVQVHGVFLGITELNVFARRGAQVIENDHVPAALPVTVTRPQRVIDRVFTSSVATFVSLIFINFGCAMHWPTVKEVLKRPVGPIIGICGQFILMPLLSFGLGFLIFPDEPEMRLGMFFTGVSPSGGASNIWTFILGGNLNMSLAMTSISTLAAFALMPAWLFSLGQVVFRDANIVVPYARIASFVLGLLIPLGIGLAMQRFTPRLAAFMVRILKGFSATLLLFIIVFAIVTNIYIFQLFSWQIIVAGMGIPWLGYSLAYLVARLLRQPHPDALAICIETGIQNTGISIFLLRYALEQPAADITTVVPVSVAIMTPIPMTAIYIYQKISACVNNRHKHKKIAEEDNTPISETPEPLAIATIEGTKKVDEENNYTY